MTTLESLITALSDVEPETRAAAAEALGRERDPKAVAALVRATFDGDSQVQMKAAAALGQTEDGRAVNALVQVISEGAANCGKHDEPRRWSIHIRPLSAKNLCALAIKVRIGRAELPGAAAAARGILPFRTNSCRARELHQDDEGQRLGSKPISSLVAVDDTVIRHVLEVAVNHP